VRELIYYPYVLHSETFEKLKNTSGNEIWTIFQKKTDVENKICRHWQLI